MVFCYYAHNSVWTCELGYGADTMFHRTYFLYNNTLETPCGCENTSNIFFHYKVHIRSVKACDKLFTAAAAAAAVNVTVTLLVNIAIQCRVANSLSLSLSSSVSLSLVFLHAAKTSPDVRTLTTINDCVVFYRFRLNTNNFFSLFAVQLSKCRHWSHTYAVTYIAQVGLHLYTTLINACKTAQRASCGRRILT